MEKPLSYYFFRILNKLSYKYNFFSIIKNYLRSIKYFLFGKNDIALVISEIKRTRETGNKVKVVFDVGAAVGDKTIAFLKSFPDATIYSFEPQIESLNKFKKRTAAYGNRVRIFDFGFLNKNDVVFLNIDSYRDSSSILPVQKHTESKGIGGVEKISIRVEKLDDFVGRQKIEHIDLIKIDVEGAEKEVLEGGKETFRNKIDNVFVEISPLKRGPHSRDFLDVLKFFYETGFTFIGCYGDYFFSKDKDLIKKYF